MVKTNDVPKAYTAEDVIRRFDLNSLTKDRASIKSLNNGLTKVENQLYSFIVSVLGDIANLQDQIDGNITTWFFVGVPTLLNEPAVNWDTDEEKNNHLGDLYYDSNTGYAYRFALINDAYSWEKITDSDVAEALAIANSALDTADSKRRVFVTTPTPPYDVGDIWIKDDADLYRCSASRASGSYSAADWVIATKYTDDAYAMSVESALNDFITTVTTTYATLVQLQTTADSINASVQTTATQLTNDYISQVNTLRSEMAVTDSEIMASVNSKIETDLATMENRVMQSIGDTYTKTEIQNIVSGVGVDGVKVSSVQTISGTFDANGMTYEKTGAKSKTTINEVGVNVKDDNNNPIMFAGYVDSNNTQYSNYVGQTIVAGDNMNVKKYFSVGSHSRMEDYDTGTGMFYIG